MQRTQQFAGLLLLLGFVVGAGRGFADDPPNAKPEPKVEFVNRVDRQGVVEEVTKDSITVAFPELVWAGGVAPAKPSKKFAVSETLAAGKVPMEARQGQVLPHQPNRRYHVSPSNMYRLSDVKARDWVYIVYARVDGVDTCDHISICKRPGGRMPPLPEEAEALRRPRPEPVRPGFPPPPPYIPYNEYWDAYWDLEDKGIPYPEKFGKDRRWPVAPPPREVKVGPAIAP